MSSPIITKVIEEMNDLPDELQQQVLTFVLTLRQGHILNLVMPGMLHCQAKGL